MPLPTIAGTVRATFRGTTGTATGWANVLHARYAGGASTPGSTEIAQLHAKLLRLYSGASYTTGAAYLTFCKTTLNLADATYYVLNGIALPQIININVSGTGGTSNQLPNEVSPVLTLRTDTRGRRYRGRIYFPPPLATFCDANGNWTSTFMANIATQYTGLQADLASIQWELGVASYGKSLIDDPNDKHDKIEVTWAPFFTKVTSVVMDLKPDVQRRRK
jgi:hypothetical protein